MKWMIRNKQQLSTVETDSNFKQVMTYLNKMQSEKADLPQSKNTQKTVAEK